MASPRPLLAALLILASPATAAPGDSPYLFVIPAERVESQPGRPDSPLLATLHVPDGRRAAEIIRAGGALEVQRVADDEVSVAFSATPTLSGDPDNHDRDNSFVIDYAEDEIVTVLEEVRRRHGKRPDTGDLVEFVFRHIENKTYKASFDVASRVAATRSGDCTEHAVLLTALARATGRPARVAVGVALIESTDRLSAFGHAWSEIHDGERWQLADATVPAGPTSAMRISYLPFITLENEGPGYAFDLARIAAIQPARISGITLPGTANDDHPSRH